MLSENQLVTIAISVIGGIGAAIVSACGVVWALFKFFLDVIIKKTIEVYDKEIIQQRCKDHKEESREDLKGLNDKFRDFSAEMKENFTNVFKLFNDVNKAIIEIAMKK